MKIIKSQAYKKDHEKDEKNEPEHGSDEDTICRCPGPAFGTPEWDAQESTCPKCQKYIYR